jgi:hypothetical protein
MSEPSEDRDADELSAPHAPASSTDTHPRPSAVEALERSHLRKPLDARAQRSIWIWFFVVIALLVSIGVVMALRHPRHAESGAVPAPERH